MFIMFQKHVDYFKIEHKTCPFRVESAVPPLGSFGVEGTVSIEFEVFYNQLVTISNMFWGFMNFSKFKKIQINKINK